MKAKTRKCPFCQSEIDKKAKVCPVCKRPQKAHGCLPVIVTLLFIFAVAVFTLSKFIQPADDKYITLEEFNQIQSGMTYEEVQDIVGSPGTITADSSIAGIRTVIVMWYANPDTGTNANVTFQNDAVVSKAQVGLK